MRRGLATVEDLVRARLPRSVLACEEEQWHWRAVHKTTGAVKLFRFRCNSWRHPGPCRNACQQAKRERIEKTLALHPWQDVSFLVLTLDPKIWVNGSWLGRPDVAYTALKNLWRSYAKWVKRNYGFAGYVNTVEAHRSGMPHLNVLMVSKPLAAELREDDAWRTVEALKAAARRSHFGRMSAESADDPKQLASYITKVAVEHNERTERARQQLAGEATKQSQIPYMAPPGTRIFRPSKGFLVPVDEKESEYSAELVRKPASRVAGLVVRIRFVQLTLCLREREPEQLSFALAA